jgi:hypothetical protein
MAFEVVQRILREQPFRPISVRMSDGDVFEIRRPEAAMLVRSSLLIALPGQEWPVTCALLHINDIRPLETASAA